VEILTDEKPRDIRRSGELRWICILYLDKGFKGYLKGSAGHQVTRNVLGLIGD
jgi:hypothetical protein